MIQATTKTNIKAYLSTEDNRINTSVTSAHIRHLVKFINDMDGSIVYSYPAEVIADRFTEMTFTYEATTPSEFLGEVNLLPSGYWKYEVYEVSWIGTVSINSEQAPATEKESIEPIGDDIGVVQGLVTKGKLNLSDYKGTSQVQYKEHETEEGTNYIYYGQ
jgi:hypothetical protein